MGIIVWKVISPTFFQRHTLLSRLPEHYRELYRQSDCLESAAEPRSVSLGFCLLSQLSPCTTEPYRI